MEYLLYYVLFSTAIYSLLILFTIFYNKIEPEKNFKLSEELLSNFFISYVPVINAFYLFLLILVCLISFLDKKFNPENASFKLLDDILCLYIIDGYVNEHFSKFIDRLKENIEILGTKLDAEPYKILLKQYDFTFVRIKSIIEESSKLNENAQNKVLLTSKELIDGFLQEFQQLLDKDNEIESVTEEVILNRFIKELDEEKIIQYRRMVK
jgi:hypothetical protein